MDAQEVERLAKIIWDYHLMRHKLQKADAIVVLGSYDLRVAERGADLFLAGWAPLLVLSGGYGNFTPKEWGKPEAEKFAEVAMGMGVPPEKILIENKSSNTGENVAFTREILRANGIVVRKIIAVQKPYMERRTYATFKKVWPEIDVLVTSPQISFEDYPVGYVPEKKIIGAMVGDLQRIKSYPEKGFQIAQEIPVDVWDACERLASAGYTNYPKTE